MNVNKVILTALLPTLLGVSAAHAEGPYAGTDAPAAPPPVGAPALPDKVPIPVAPFAAYPGDPQGAPVPGSPFPPGGNHPYTGSVPNMPPTTPPPAPGPAPGLSNWITYTCPDCCSAGGPPILMELYARAGLSVPIGGPIFQPQLDTGWVIAGGGRTLFFNHAADKAWTIDLGLTNINNYGRNEQTRVPLLNVLVERPQQQQNQFQNNAVRVPVQFVTIKRLNRTYVNFLFGREWYLLGTCRSDGTRWRAGFDVGGRYGTEKLEMRERHYRSDVIGAVTWAAHTDLDIPCGGACVFQTGFRFEWDYTWSDILQAQNNAEIMSANVLFTVGVRF